jgi:hypothetical protein
VLGVLGKKLYRYSGVGWMLLEDSAAGLQTIRAATFDSRRGQLVALTQGPQTWEWDGSTWSKKAPLVSPPAEGALGMAYNPDLGRAVLVTGSETWMWTGEDWNRINSTGLPAVADGEHRCLAFDPRRGRVQLLGDRLGRQDLWELDGSTWAPGPC